MSEDLIIDNCSPTLAGIKTASLFTCSFDTIDDLFVDIRNFNRRFRNKGLLVIPIKIWDNKALIYVYRPAMLENDLKDFELLSLLNEKDYRTGSINECLVSLIKKLKSYKEFPHEIGAFLGYPPEDVIGFIKNKARNSKYVGYWKVYGDVNKSKAIFDRYSNCTRIYREAYSRGRSIDSLLV